ncbi:MAG: hypothetical protein U1F43_23410 [Myxococcota bacterium]
MTAPPAPRSYRRVARRPKPSPAPPPPTPEADAAGQDIDQRELERRLVHALARLVGRFAGAFSLPMGEVVDLVQSAQLQVLRERGLTLGEIGRRLDVSERHAKRLLKQLRESFLDTEKSYDLPVRIEFMLWAQPMSRARLKQVLRDEPAAIDGALERLVSEGRIVESGERTPLMRPTAAVQSLVRDTWLMRIGALNSFLANLGDAIYGRFLSASPRSFARTLNFLVRPEDEPLLQRFFEESLVPFATRLDEAGHAAAAPAESFRMSVCWSPYEWMTRSVEAAEALAAEAPADAAGDAPPEES